MSEGKIELYNEDNMQLMARYPDKYFDLAIVDPPYGIDMDGGKIGIAEQERQSNTLNMIGIKKHLTRRILMN